MTRLVSILTLLVLLQARVSLAYSVALTHGVPSGTVPAAGDLLFNQRLYLVAPDQLIGRVDGHHALPGGDGDPNAPRTYFFQLKGATVKSGQVYLKSFDGLVGFVGQVGDLDAEVPFAGARRVLLAPGTKLDAVGDRFDVISFAVPGDAPASIELAGTLTGIPAPQGFKIVDAWLTVSDTNVSQIEIEASPDGQPNAPVHKIVAFKLDWRLVRGAAIGLPQHGNPLFFWDGSREIFLGLAPQSWFGYRVQLAPNVHIVATPDSARLVIEPSAVAKQQALFRTLDSGI